MPPTPPATSKRLAFFEKTTAGGSTDPLAWYGMAMEYRGLERREEALVAFTKLRELHPDYVAAYLMCGQLLQQMGQVADAKIWLGWGIDAAKKKGDDHALSELEALLGTLG